MADILITGAGGFIGVNLAKHLLQNHKIIGLDNERRNTLQYFPEVSEHENFHYTKGDILDEKLLKELVKDVDIVLHLAAMAGVSSYYKEPFKILEVNAIGTYKLLQAIKGSKVKQLVNFSTSETYGTEAANVKESDNTTQGAVPEKRWVYSISKTVSDHMCFAFGAENPDVKVTSIRLFNIYGPGQTGEGAIRNFALNALKNEDLEITGDGEQIRAWCHVADVVKLIDKILNNPDETNQNVFNAGNPKTRCTIIELAEMIIKIAGSTSKIKFVEHVGVDIRKRYPNIDKAKEILGFSPKIELEEGLKDSIEWYKKVTI